MNNINLIGRVATDIIKNHIEMYNKDVISFALAFSDRVRKSDGEKPTHFIDCEAWADVATRIYENVRKGDKIAISGHIEQAKYTRKDGSKASKIKVVISTCEYLSPKHTPVDENQIINDEILEDTENLEDDKLPF